jgi:hypothetical protein
LLLSPIHRSRGTTISVSNVEEIMPPIIGTAIRGVISDPVPLLHMIGSNHDSDHRHLQIETPVPTSARYRRRCAHFG